MTKCACPSRLTRLSRVACASIALAAWCAVAFHPAAASASGGWTTRKPMPTGRTGAGVGVVNGILYVVGGDSPSLGTQVATVEAYDPTTDTWTTKKPMSVARSGLAVAVVNGILYAIGGWVSQGDYNAPCIGPCATVEAYNPATNAWTTKRSMPTARYSLAVAVVNNIIYAVGGGNAPIEAYNPATNTWSSPWLQSYSDFGPAAGTINNVFYAMGGTTFDYSAGKWVKEAKLMAYTPSSESWVQKTSMPTARGDLAAAVVNNVLYAIGGGTDSAVLGTVEAYDPTADMWRSLPPMPTPRSGLGVGAINGIIYAVGGYPGFQTLEAFDPAIAGPPGPPGTGAVATGRYRNAFQEIGASAASSASSRLDTAYNQLFVSGDASTQRVYFEDATGAYILDTDPTHNDVRSEGMSYGMMIAVQMNDKTRFDRLWTWARKKMYRSDTGWFAWRCSTSGAVLDSNPAPDGDEYIATALFMAAGRWGNGADIYDYQTEADKLLDVIKLRMFASTSSYGNLVVFSPSGSGAGFTDPSYHVPAFYTYWSRVAARNRDFWAAAATSSRAFLKRTLERCATCLPPDYAEFDGLPVLSSRTGITDLALHQNFRYDAWRVAGNLALDYAWYAPESWQVEQATRLQKFFASRPSATGYGSLWKADGSGLMSETGAANHAPGHVAMNALAGLASTDAVSWQILNDALSLSIPTGAGRYYGGLLYLLAMLNLTGRFQAYAPAIPADDYASAPTITSMPLILSANTAAATTDLFDPTPYRGSASRTVWVKIVPPRSGILWIDTFGSSYNTVVTLYTGAPSTWSTVAGGGNDDARGTLQSEVRVRVTAGTTYSLMVSSYSGTGGTLRLRLRMPTEGDYDGDSKADIAVYRPSDGTWWGIGSKNGYAWQSGYLTTAWGNNAQVPAPGDYDGDGLMDLGVFTPASGDWWLLLSSKSYSPTNGYTNVRWGMAGDLPVPADYDGDGWTDIGIYRPSSGEWWALLSSKNYDWTQGYLHATWGLPSDIPVPADFDGDGKSDLAVFRPTSGDWWILKSSNGYSWQAGYMYLACGIAGDVPAVGDYDGDGKADAAVYRPTTGDWWILKSGTGYTWQTGGYLHLQWGGTPLVAAPRDFDGDGKTDAAVFDVTNGDWWILRSSNNYSWQGGYWHLAWGIAGDTPVGRIGLDHNPSKVLFDDFSYATPQAMLGWAGANGAVWYAYDRNVTSGKISVAPGDGNLGHLVLKQPQGSVGVGPAGSDTVADTNPTVWATNWYLGGTYAARIKLEAPDPNLGPPPNDKVVETFWVQTPATWKLLEKYAELDFEFLPSNFWGSPSGVPVMWLNAWDRADGSATQKAPQSIQVDLRNKWVTCLLSVAQGQARFRLYDDNGAPLDAGVLPVPSAYAPEADSVLRIMFSVWAEWNSSLSSNYTMRVDWFLLAQDDPTLTRQSVVDLVSFMRAQSVRRKDSTSPLQAPQF